MNDNFPNCPLSLLRRLKCYRFWLYCGVLLAVGTIMLMGFFPTPEDPNPPEIIVGSCPDHCSLKACKMYMNLNDYDQGPCSCDRINSNNITSTFCSNFQTKPPIVSSEPLSFIAILFCVTLGLSMISCCMILSCSFFIPKDYTEMSTFCFST